MKLDFVRLGQKHKVHEEIRPFVVEEATRHITTVDKLDQFYQRMVMIWYLVSIGALHAGDFIGFFVLFCQPNSPTYFEPASSIINFSV